MFFSDVDNVESLSIIKNRFKAEAFNFPGLVHVLMVWPQSEAIPAPPSKLNFESFRYGIKFNVRIYRPGLNCQHWLFKSECEGWYTDRGIERFESLANTAGCFAANVKRECHTWSNILDVSDPVERWLLLLQELNESPRMVGWYMDDVNYSPQQAVIDMQKRFISVISDLFLESSLTCCRLIERFSGSMYSLRENRTRFLDCYGAKKTSTQSTIVASSDTVVSGETEFIGFGEAADILKTSRSTIHRLAAAGTLRDNGQKGRQRRISKMSILFHKHQKEQELIYRDGLDLHKAAQADNNSISNLP